MVLDVFSYPQKTYLKRVLLEDGSAVDVAAYRAEDKDVILLAYRYTPAEFVEGTALSIQSILDGYSAETSGTLFIVQDDQVIASNRPELIGQGAADSPLVQGIRKAGAAEKLTHTRDWNGSGCYFGMFCHGRSFDLYAYTDEKMIFRESLSLVLTALVGYILLVMVLQLLRRRSMQEMEQQKKEQERKYQTQLEEQNRKLEIALQHEGAANRAKREFLFNMSHDIRTPMNAIIGFTSLAATHIDNREQVLDYLKKISTSSQHLLSLINDVLDMSRIESGKMELEQNPFSLNVLLCDIESMLTAEAERRELTFRVEKNLQDDVFIGDTVRLRQVILNLLSNAFKFTPSGGTVWLRVTEPSFTETTGNVLVQVIDTGIGISEENQKRIFRSFEQVGPNATKCQGTGLGLAISRNIIKLMGGEILVKSELGKGSEFSFSISMLKGELHELPETKTNAKEISFTGVTILLAEDNDLNAEIAIELLQTQGAEVYRAENGKQALELFRDSPEGTFQVILMDIMMPEMNGLEAASSIRALKHPDAERIPIIAMTANTFKEDVESALNAGMTGFVSKPIDVAYLYQELNSVLSNSKRD